MTAEITIRNESEVTQNSESSTHPTDPNDVSNKTAKSTESSSYIRPNPSTSDTILPAVTIIIAVASSLLT
jgi:hypothetical protein